MQPSTSCCILFLIAEKDCFGRDYIREEARFGSIGTIVFLDADDDKRDERFYVARRFADGSRSVFDVDGLKTKMEEENFWFFRTDDVHQVFWKGIGHQLP